MSTTFVLATGCANGLQRLVLERHSCSGTDCNGDALWYAAQMQRGCNEVAAQMHGFYTGCCSVRTSLQYVGCNCDSAVLCNLDAGVMRLVCNVDAAVVRSMHNSASTFIRSYVADDVASVHHRACRLRCKVVATGVAMLFYSAASSKQYGRRSFALPILRDADVRYTDVCRNLRSNGGCVSQDANTAVGGEILKRERTCYKEYLQCADATASESSGSSVGIAHTPGGKCADTLSFPNFKATTSQEIRRLILKPHAESAERILNTNRANFSNGNVGSRLGATEWTGRLLRFVLTSRNGERDSPAAPHICPISTSSASGRIMPRIPNKPSENARKSLAGCGGRLSKTSRNGDSADTPVETRCSHKGLPSDTVFFR